MAVVVSDDVCVDVRVDVRVAVCVDVREAVCVDVAVVVSVVVADLLSVLVREVVAADRVKGHQAKGSATTQRPSAFSACSCARLWLQAESSGTKHRKDSKNKSRLFINKQQA